MFQYFTLAATIFNLNSPITVIPNMLTDTKEVYNQGVHENL